jgi:hypothetical protein
MTRGLSGGKIGKNLIFDLGKYGIIFNCLIFFNLQEWKFQMTMSHNKCEAAKDPWFKWCITQ